jgi:hypothetical protein
MAVHRTRNGLIPQVPVGKVSTVQHPSFASRLVALFNPAAAGHFDGSFACGLPDERVALSVREGHLEVLDRESPVDFTLLFRDVEDAVAILQGREDVIEAFMAGRLRADGYLIRVFGVLAMFRG